jgi:hypothetical protein
MKIPKPPKRGNRYWNEHSLRLVQHIGDYLGSKGYCYRSWDEQGVHVSFSANRGEFVWSVFLETNALERLITWLVIDSPQLDANWREARLDSCSTPSVLTKRYAASQRYDHVIAIRPLFDYLRNCELTAADDSVTPLPSSVGDVDKVAKTWILRFEAFLEQHDDSLLNSTHLAEILLARDLFFSLTGTLGRVNHTAEAVFVEQALIAAMLFTSTRTFVKATEACDLYFDGIQQLIAQNPSNAAYTKRAQCQYARLREHIERVKSDYTK